MTVVAEPWLPPITRAPHAVHAVFEQVIAAWSAHWFAGEPMAAGVLTRPDARASLRKAALAWRGTYEGLMIGLAPDAPLTIGLRMLDIPDGDRTGSDRVLVEAIAEPCLEDLCARLAKAVAAATPDAWRPDGKAPDWTLPIGRSIAIGVTDAMFATLVKRSLESDRRPPLRAGTDALAGIAIDVAAAVGRVDMTVADLRALEVGDVVVLDRRIEDAVPIAINGSAIDRGRVRVVSSEPSPFLKIIDAAA